MIQRGTALEYCMSRSNPSFAVIQRGGAFGFDLASGWCFIIRFGGLGLMWLGWRWSGRSGFDWCFAADLLARAV